jgi:hypothetical protein
VVTRRAAKMGSTGSVPYTTGLYPDVGTVAAAAICSGVVSLTSGPLAMTRSRSYMNVAVSLKYQQPVASGLLGW